MKNEQLRTSQQHSILLKKPEVIEFEKENYQYGLFFPIVNSYDLSAIASDLLLGNLFVNVTAQQLSDLRDTLNNISIPLSKKE